MYDVTVAEDPFWSLFKEKGTQKTYMDSITVVVVIIIIPIILSSFQAKKI